MMVGCDLSLVARATANRPPCGSGASATTPLSKVLKIWWADADLNCGPWHFQCHALPTELSARPSSSPRRACWLHRYRCCAEDGSHRCRSSQASDPRVIDSLPGPSLVAEHELQAIAHFRAFTTERRVRAGADHRGLQVDLAASQGKVVGDAAELQRKPGERRAGEE